MTFTLIILFFFGAVVAVPAISYFVADYFTKKWEVKELNRISEKYAAQKIADEKHHAEFMAGIDAMQKENDAKLLAIKNCPKWKKLKAEINSEHAAMIKGRNQFNAIMGR